MYVGTTLQSYSYPLSSHKKCILHKEATSRDFFTFHYLCEHNHCVVQDHKIPDIILTSAYNVIHVVYGLTCFNMLLS